MTPQQFQQSFLTAKRELSTFKNGAEVSDIEAYFYQQQKSIAQLRKEILDDLAKSSSNERERIQLLTTTIQERFNDLTDLINNE